MLRLIAGILIIGFLAACQPEPLKPAAPGLRLDNTGLRPVQSDLRVDFWRAQKGVISAVSKLLGTTPSSQSSVPGCGTVVVWADQLELTFIDGNFIGWAAKPALFDTSAAQPDTRSDGWLTKGKACQ